MANTQLQLADLGENWLARALASPMPLRVTNKVSLELHQEDQLVRCIEHVPHRNRGTEKRQEVLRLINGGPSAEDVYELVRLRASLKGQTINGSLITDVGFSATKDRLGVQIRTPNGKVGSIRETTEPYTPGNARAAAQQMFNRIKEEI